MDIFVTIATVVLGLVVLSALVFICGPAVLELVVDKIEEWEGIIDSLKEEK